MVKGGILMETAIFVKKVLFKSFLMGFVFIIFATLCYTYCFDFMYNTFKIFFPIPKEEMLKMVLYAISFWKIILVQFFLLPTLALHCLTCKCHKKND